MYTFLTAQPLLGSFLTLGLGWRSGDHCPQPLWDWGGIPGAIAHSPSPPLSLAWCFLAMVTLVALRG